MNLGETIYKLRTAKNMSQGDLADALEVSRQSVSKWENNSAVPELDKLKKLSQIFEVTLDELVGGEPKPAFAPQPQTIVYNVPEKKPLSESTIAGIILMGCAAVVMIAMAVLGDFASGLLLAVPFVLNGSICLICKKNAGFVCCWATYCLIWLYQFMVMVNTVESAQVIMLVMFILLAALIAWSLYKLYAGQFGAGKAKKIVWTIILAILLLLQAFLAFMPQSPSRSTSDDDESGFYVSVE